MSAFVDRVTVHVRGGDGGNGASSIKREKYKPLAGPDGGNGGDGGSVIFVADSNATSLLDYRFLPHRSADSGTMGLGGDKDGSKGEDVLLPVPIGTVVFDAQDVKAGKKAKTAKPLADLRHPGERFIAAHGGNGGLGNRSLANRTRRAPGFALLGEPGEERDILLELKSIADVALVGFPSAGKSSLIAAMSSAKPKIADYPFTTLVPNLGVVEAGDQRFTIADVPGLIPGASQGKGLGLEFLRHIERTEIIAHVIDCATLEPDRDPIADYHALENELSAYADALDLPLGVIPIADRPRIVVLNKCDVPEAKELAEFVRPEFESMGLRVFEVSTASHEGLKELRFALSELVSQLREKLAEQEREQEQERVVIRPLETGRPRRRNDETGFASEYSIKREQDRNGNHWFVVSGTKPERWVMQTNFDNDEAVGYLGDRLAKLGVEDALRRAGAHPGDEVHIGQGKNSVEFDWDPTIIAGAEMLDGEPMVSRGKDLRLVDQDGYARRRSNSERREQYHEMMDARQAVRDAMMAERKAGHWADPAVKDDPKGKQYGIKHAGDAAETSETAETSQAQTEASETSPERAAEQTTEQNVGQAPMPDSEQESAQGDSEA